MVVEPRGTDVQNLVVLPTPAEELLIVTADGEIGLSLHCERVPLAVLHHRLGGMGLPIRTAGEDLRVVHTQSDKRQNAAAARLESFPEDVQQLGGVAGRHADIIIVKDEVAAAHRAGSDIERPGASSRAYQAAVAA